MFALDNYTEEELTGLDFPKSFSNLYLSKGGHYITTNSEVVETIAREGISSNRNIFPQK
jgi:hypothetical protein